MAVKSGEKRGKYKKRVDAILPTYAEMYKVNDKVNMQKVTWRCKKCSSNSLMPIEFGCDYCQPFTNNKLRGRVYVK